MIPYVKTIVKGTLMSIHFYFNSPIYVVYKSYFVKKIILINMQLIIGYYLKIIWIKMSPVYLNDLVSTNKILKKKNNLSYCLSWTQPCLVRYYFAII